MKYTKLGMCDEELWQSFQEGDKQSYAALYEVYFPVLYEYGMRLRKDAEIVKDCIQDLFVKLWVNRGNLKQTDAVRPYLYTALRNGILNRLSQAGRMAKREERASQTCSFDICYTAEDTLIRMDEQAARSVYVTKALNRLTPRQKESIFLRFYVGLNYEEIAAIMQISVKASYKITGRAIDFMRKYFKEAAAYSLLLVLLLLK
jgi:RNA polymerase sigma factor (sigma-70 family)